MKNQTKAYIFALLAILCWSTVATAFKIALDYVDFMQLLLFSSLVASITVLVILFIQGKAKQLLKQSGKDWISSLLLGLLNPFLYYVILFKAFSILPAQEAMTLNYSWPIMLVLLSAPFLKQKLTVKSIFALFVSFSGIIIIATKGNLVDFEFTNLTGDLLAIGSSIIWALFWIFNIRDKRDEPVKLFFSFTIGFFLSLILVFVFSEIPSLNFDGVLAVAYVGLFEMGITFVLWLLALKYSERTDKVSQLIFLSPFFSLFFISIILNEKILTSTILGLVLIVAGILLQQLKRNNKNMINK